MTKQTQNLHFWPYTHFYYIQINTYRKFVECKCKIKGYIARRSCIACTEKLFVQSLSVRDFSLHYFLVLSA